MMLCDKNIHLNKEVKKLKNLKKKCLLLSLLLKIDATTFEVNMTSYSQAVSTTIDSNATGTKKVFMRKKTISYSL